MTQPISASGPSLPGAAPGAGRDARLSSGSRGEYTGAAPEIEVPAEYRPPEAEREAPRRSEEVVQRTLTLDERRRAEADPVVRQTLALFDGILLDVRWPSPKATSGQRSEKCSETSANS